MADKATLYLEDILEDMFICLENNDLKLAKVLIKKASKKHPRHYLSFYGQALFMCFKGELDKAVGLFQKSIAIESHYSFAHYNLAITFKKLHRADLAIKHYWAAKQCATEEELEAMPEVLDVIESLKAHLPTGFTVEQYLKDAEDFDSAVLLMESGKFEQASEVFKVIASNQPEHVQVRGNLGICSLMLQQYHEAEDYFQQALALDPEYAPAVENLAILEKVKNGVLKQSPPLQTRYYYAEKSKASKDSITQ